MIFYVSLHYGPGDPTAFMQAELPDTHAWLSHACASWRYELRVLGPFHEITGIFVVFEDEAEALAYRMRFVDPLMS